MKIAIVSTRGIPNNYGGFEQFAENISVNLVNRGYSITVYNPHFHPYKESKYKGVNIVRIYSPEKQIGTAANFVYDFLSLKHAIKNYHDIILCCGYTTSSVFFPLLKFKKSKLITNVDGIEWKRSKYSPIVQKLTKWFEKLAIKNSYALIADNIGIGNYLKDEYNVPSHFISYGADSEVILNKKNLDPYWVIPFEYDVLIARMEPENNIEVILNTYAENQNQKILVVGSTQNNYGRKMRNLFSKFSNIAFLEWINDPVMLNSLRHFARLYIHGHSVGGTNPSLLEAMAAQSFIVAHNNEFNKSVLGPNALYFKTQKELAEIIVIGNFKDRELFLKNNLKKIKTDYTWENITNNYIKLFEQTCINYYS